MTHVRDTCSANPRSEDVFFFVMGSVIKSLCMPESMSLFQHSVSRMLAEKRLHVCRKPVGQFRIDVSYCVLFYEDPGNGLLTHYDIYWVVKEIIRV